MRSILSDNRGKSNPWMVLLVVGVLAVAGILGYQAMKPGISNQQVIGSDQSDNGGSMIVTVNPIYSFAGVDAAQPGTVVGVASAKASVNGGAYSTVTAGTTTAVPGQVVDLLLVNTTVYHSQKVEGVKITPGVFPLAASFNKNGTVSQNMYSTTGLVITNNATTGTNQSALGDGVSYNFKFETYGAALTNTQDLTCVVEVTNGTSLTSNPVGVTIDGAAPKSTATPSWYAPVGTSSRVFLFDMPAVTSTMQTHNMAVNVLSTESIDATSKIIKRCYSKEYFIDSATGKLAYDVADSQGTLQSIQMFQYVINFS